MNQKSNFILGGNAIVARKHNAEMEEKYPAEICDSKNRSIIFENVGIQALFKTAVEKDKGPKPYVILSGKDTVSAAFEYGTGTTAILNFASYQEPGGGFLTGAMAQEESLCHASTLYEVLSGFPNYYEANKRYLNRGLYLNRSLYSPDIVFELDENVKKIDVITCAAPNASAFLYFNKDYGDIERAIESRIMFIKHITEAVPRKIDTLILGAYGCGVFGCNADKVADTFKKYFSASGVKNIVFAIMGSESPNYKAFQKTLGDYVDEIKL